MSGCESLIIWLLVESSQYQKSKQTTAVITDVCPPPQLRRREPPAPVGRQQLRAGLWPDPALTRLHARELMRYQPQFAVGFIPERTRGRRFAPGRGLSRRVWGFQFS